MGKNCPLRGRNTAGAVAVRRPPANVPEDRGPARSAVEARTSDALTDYLNENFA
ncbi:hypothetical protein [Streptomyces sp.]|uniref:hypothetical protein n=1 Tax=Streptomyces sp. TaxID=1931 RepID=UPI002D76E320|nr:hypothetical protein [Streptomyces sp.]HET6355592.1 hypothetical protein [Streptomyces sp.]